MKKWISLLILCLFLLPSAALRAETREVATTGDYLAAIGTKLGRGVTNVLTSPAEIPCTMAVDMEGQPVEGFFTGLGKGTLFMLRRILVGVTEIGTFIIPMERDLAPVCHEPL